MKRIGLAFLVVLALASGLIGAAFAQTTPTTGEKQIGNTGCKNAAASADFDTLAQCTSTGATSGTFQKAPLFVGTVTAPPYTTTNCDAAKAGMIQYTGGVVQYCNGSAWSTMGSSMADGTAGAPGLYFSADTNTGLYRPTTDNLAIATGGVERLRVTATGSVGIGTTTPSYPLHVVSSGSSYAGYFSGIYGVAGVATTNVGVYGSSTSSWGGYFVGFKGLNARTTAAASYAIQGEATQSNSWAVIGGGASCTGWLGYGSYSAGGSCGTSFSSDERLKKEITPVESGLDIVMKLRPVSYLWKRDGKNHELVTNQKKKAANYGFIAQDVMKVLPDLVTETPPEFEGLPKPGEAAKKAEKKETMYGLDYNGFIAPTVAAVQELNAKLEKMKAENDALRAMAKAQNARLNALEARGR